MPLEKPSTGYETTMGQSNFVPKHRKVATKTFNNRKAIDKMYDNDWQRYRAKFLAINNECYACGKPSQVVDHLIPHKGDQRLFEKLDNHIPLCTPCHNTVTTKFDRDYRPGNSVTEKIKWLNLRRIPGDGRNPKRVKKLTSYK